MSTRTDRQNPAAVLVLLGVAGLSAGSCVAQTPGRGRIAPDPVRPGIVANVQLRYLAPPRLAPACDALVAHDSTAAAAAFREALLIEPGSAPAWLGLCQADPWFLRSETERLADAPVRDLSAAFRAGVLALYKWGTAPVASSIVEEISEVQPARDLLKRAWDSGRGEILAGVMYVESLEMVGEKMDEPLAVSLQILQRLMPPAVWRDYLSRRSSSRWSEAPPSADAVPLPARPGLYAGLAVRWSLLRVRADYYAPAAGNRLKLLRRDGIPPQKKREADYLERWFRLLKAHC